MLTAPTMAFALLIGVTILRFTLDAQGIMLLAVVPVTLLGMLLGRMGGLLSALFASAALLVWSMTGGEVGTLELINEPLTLLVIGFVTGTWARGALGSYDVESTAMIWRVRSAARSGGLVMHYQPIVGAGTDAVVAIEALARWTDSKRGPVPPSTFIPAIERNKQAIWALTLHTLETAAADAATWPGEGFQIALNISPAVLERPELPEAIDRILREHALGAERLVLEVTENVVADATPGLLAAIDGFRAQGITAIAIDDFGVGQSSLSRLDRLPVDILKIDRALVGRMDHEQTRAIVTAITAMGHALRLRVVGEGVEDSATREMLVDAGCDDVQGFGIAKPMSPDELAGWLIRRHGRPGDMVRAG